MSMRKQFVSTLENLLSEDERLVLLLGDIGVFGFRQPFERYPSRVYNIGILEQATIGLSAGLAMLDLIPVVHTIAPFLVERSFEQLKIDFAYQKLGGNFISVGASYDYAALGCTHHCPGDVGILKNIPGMEIITPGTDSEFDILFRQCYANGKPTYFRLSEKNNTESKDVNFGKANLIKKGNDATIIVVGTMLDVVLEAAKDFDVNVLYYTTLTPFDQQILKENSESGRILLCEPYYSGALALDIIKALFPRKIVFDTVGVPHEFMEDYGKAEEHDERIGLTVNNIKSRIKQLIYA
ncbi:MAG: hypothetical protein NT091_02395 [Candidatus Falkowbacteria bacterium]|nr:hypothetical protein [Candidatus Falkowbacteria bacterium]